MRLRLRKIKRHFTEDQDLKRKTLSGSRQIAVEKGLPKIERAFKKSF